MSTLQRIDTFIVGYARKYSSVKSIPQDLVDLIIAMYFDDKDEWDLKSSSPSFNFDKNTIIGPQCKIPDHQYYRDHYYAFGSIVIGEGENKTWKLKLKSICGESLYIGIIAVNDKEIKHDGAAYDHAFIQLNNAFGKYVGNRVTGDVISMRLEIGYMHATLSYKINGREFGTAFKNINISKTYCLAVSMCAQDKIELMNVCKDK